MVSLWSTTTCLGHHQPPTHPCDLLPYHQLVDKAWAFKFRNLQNWQWAPLLFIFQKLCFQICIIPFSFEHRLVLNLLFVCLCFSKCMSMYLHLHLNLKWDPWLLYSFQEVFYQIRITFSLLTCTITFVFDLARVLTLHG